MAQLVERILGKDEVPSSTLGISTIKYEALQVTAGLFCLCAGHGAQRYDRRCLVTVVAIR